MGRWRVGKEKEGGVKGEVMERNRERRERKGRKEHGAREREEGHGAGRFWATQWKRHDQESAQEACANTQIHAMCSQVLENRHVGKAFSPHSNSLTYFACK